MIAIALIIYWFCSTSAAQAQPSNATVVNDGGANAVVFDTKYGKVRCYVPSDAAPGDTISGTIFVEPSGTSKTERARMEGEINACNVMMSGQECPVRLGEYRIKLPSEGTGLFVELKDKKESQLASTTVTSGSPAGSGAGDTLSVPSATQQSGPFRCAGAFDGDFENTNAKIGGRTAVKLAESPRSLVLLCPSDVVGTAGLEVQEGERTYQSRINTISLSIEIDNSRIERGKTAIATLRVFGTENLEHPLRVKLENRSPSIVTLNGGNTQFLDIPAHAPRFDASRQVVGLRSGPFSIEANLVGNPSNQQ